MSVRRFFSSERRLTSKVCATAARALPCAFLRTFALSLFCAQTWAFAAFAAPRRANAAAAALLKFAAARGGGGVCTRKDEDARRRRPRCSFYASLCFSHRSCRAVRVLAARLPPACSPAPLARRTRVAGKQLHSACELNCAAENSRLQARGVPVGLRLVSRAPSIVPIKNRLRDSQSSFDSSIRQSCALMFTHNASAQVAQNGNMRARASMRPLAAAAVTVERDAAAALRLRAERNIASGERRS